MDLLHGKNHRMCICKQLIGAAILFSGHPNYGLYHEPIISFGICLYITTALSTKMHVFVTRVPQNAYPPRLLYMHRQFKLCTLFLCESHKSIRVPNNIPCAHCTSMHFQSTALRCWHFALHVLSSLSSLTEIRNTHH